MADIKLEIALPGEAVLKEVAGGARGALRRTFGPALSEFGEMLSDQMKLWRFRNLLGIRQKVDKLLLDHNVASELLAALPFGDAMRTLEAASQEDSDDVQQLWALLIVKAATTSERPSINKLHIEILRSLSAADSALLDLLYPSVATLTFSDGDAIKAFEAELNAKAEARWRRFSEDERGVSVQNLIRLRCITALPRLINANNLLMRMGGRDRNVWDRGHLVDANRFEDLLSQLVRLIYEASGALAYDAAAPITLHNLDYPKNALRPFGEINIPELNHMLTPLGLEFMKAVTLDRNVPAD